MVNRRSPFAGDAGSDFLNVVTNGVLVSEEQLDLSGEVSHVGGEFLWKGGTFRDYRRERIIQGVTFNESRHWATFYTGESLAKPDDMSVYVVSGLDDDGVSVAEIGYIPANVGVLLYSDKPRNGFNTSVYTGNEESFVSLLRGSLNEQTLTWYSKQDDLRASAISAVKRPISGGWGFGGEDSTPIEACALALWGVKTSKRDPSKVMRIG